MPPVAAAETGKTSHQSGSVKNSTESKNTKLCHIVKHADFDGYGFNLHSDKSKSGQFIGKIDANSPAEAAGLKEGDQILEVNGLPIGKETHKQVVQRIKAIAWEVKLLVTSEAVSEFLTKSQNKANNEKSVHDDKQLNAHAKPLMTTNSGAFNIAVSAANKINNGSSAKNHVNSANPTTPPSPLKTVVTPSAGNSTQKPDGTLKLPSTAAEMRAILQSKKKYNPKSDDVNLQKKYDIIQKL